MTTNASHQLKRILILGSGFGGLYTAMRLENKLRRAANVQVTLVNRENFFLFTPMLHEVAAGDLDVTHIVNPVRKLLRRSHFFNGDIKAINLLNDFVREAIRYYPRLTPNELRIVLIEASEAILPELGSKLGAYAREKLAQRGVEFRMKTSVKSVSNGEVSLSDGSTIKTNLFVWTAGVSPDRSSRRSCGIREVYHD